MKKVFKKFNRTLSIMLAAAMVLTMVPQTAMPVLAEEQQEVQEVEEPEVVETEEAAVVEETSETSNPTEKTEQDKQDEDVPEASDENNETLVIDSEPVEDPAEEPAEEVTDESTDDTNDLVPEAVTTTDSNPDAAVISEGAVVTPTFTNADSSDTSTPADNASIHYVGGCVSNGKMVENRDLVFRVVPKAGRVLTKVAYKIGDAATETDKTTEAKSGDVTIGKGDIFTTADGVTTGKPIAITVTTKPVEYTVTLDNSADSTNSANYKLYAVTGEGDGVLAKDAVTAAGVKANYGESLRFALVPNANQALKPDTIQLSGEDIAFEKKELAQAEAAAGTPNQTAYVFTVDPSEKKYGLETNADDNAEVTVAARALNKLTVTMTAADSNEYAYAASAAHATDTANAYINYDATEESGTPKGFAQIAEESDDLAKSLAFMVKPTAGNLVTKVTAKAGGKDVNVTTTDVTNSKDKECTIALSQLDLTEGDVVLTVSVETVLDGEADGYAVISFIGDPAGDLDHVEYKAAATEAALENAETGKNNIPVKVTTGMKYYVQVDPIKGYNLIKSTDLTSGADGGQFGAGKYMVSIREERLLEGATSTEPINYAVEAYKGDAAQAITLNLDGTVGEGDAAKNYIVKKVEITVRTEVIPNDDEKKVTFSGDLLDSVTIKNTTGVVLIDEETDSEETVTAKTYAIAEGTDLLEFEVTSETKPTVEMGGSDLTGTEGDGKYSYSIPASTLAADAENEITVNAEEVTEKSVIINMDNADVDDLDTENSTFTVDGEEVSLSHDNNNYTFGAPVGSEVSMNLAAAEDVFFGDTTYTVGDGEPQPATVSADKKTASITFTMTDAAVTVNVVTEDEISVVLNGAGVEPVEGKKNAFKADYDVKNIEVTLKSRFKGAQEIYDVVILDGTTTAETTAKIIADSEQGNKKLSATIDEIADKDYGRTLTIKVYKDSKLSYEATLAVSGTSTGVTVKMDGKDIPEAGITMPTDSQVVLTVNAEGTEANLNDLKAALAIETAAGAASTEKANDFFDEADAAGAVDIVDGKITLTAKPVKDAPKDKVFLVLSSKTVKDETDNAKDKVFKKIPINVTGLLVKSADIKEVKAEAAASSNREVRINMSLDFADEKNMPQAPMTGDLYYKVEITKVEGDAEIKKAEAATENKLELYTPAELVKFVKINKTNGSYNKAELAQFAEFDLVKNWGGSETTGTDLPGIITTEAKVTLVQSLTSGELTAASVADTDYVANTEKAKELKSIPTKAPIYETKLSVKAVNSSTIFTGQNYHVVVATPSFSKDTTCDEITVQFVDTKTGLLKNTSVGNKERDASWNTFKAGVNKDNSIWVSSSNGSVMAKLDTYKNLGVKVTAHAENDEYRASAVVKLKVQQGIYSIDTDESKAALPTTLFMDNKNKVKSVKIATILNGDDPKDKKPAKSTLTWEITDGSGRPVSDPDCDLDANIKKALLHTDNKGKAKPAITVKNGTVNVTADYQYDEKNKSGVANTFYVNAKAADFAGNDTTLNNGYPVRFEISKEAQVIEKLAVVNSSDEPAGEVSSDRNGAVVTLKAEDVIDNNLRIVALKTGAEVDRSGAYDEEDYLPATITISGKAVTLDKDYGASRPYLEFSKPGDRIAVTAKAVDGSPAKAVKMTLNVKPIEQLGLFLYGTDGSKYQPDHSAEITYSGSSNERYDMELAYVNSNGNWDVLPVYKSVKVEVKDGKLVSNKDWAKDNYDSGVGCAVVVAAGKDTATITLKDSGNKNAVKNTYTVRADVNTGSMKAPSIKMTYPKKLTAGYDEEIVWKVTNQDSKTKEYLYAGQYVKLAPDHTVAPVTDKKRSEGERDAYDMLDWDGEYYRIDENGEIETWFSSTGSEYSHYLMPGSYKLIATVGTIANGKFTPTTKDAKLSFSVPKWKKASTNLSVTTGYKLDVKTAAATKLLVKSDYGYTVSDVKNVIKKNSDQTLGDHSNNFTKYFEVKRNNYTWNSYTEEWDWSEGTESTRLYASDGDYATIGLKDDLTVDDIKDITGQIESTKKEMKDNCTGYITVDNGYFRKDFKITISFNELKKYTATATPIFASAKQVTHTVKIFNGKTPVSVLYAEIDAEGKNELDGATVKEDESGNIILTSKKDAPLAAGKYTITMKVVPTTVATVNEIKQGATDPSVLERAAMLANYAVPAELKLEVKDLAKPEKTLKTDTNIKLASYEYEDWRRGGYEFGEAGKYGKYRADVPYTLTADNIAIKGVEVKLEGNEVATGLKLVTAEAGTALVWSSSEEAYVAVPSINLTVSKEALEAAKDAREKYLYYGKSLTVPVEITYKNNSIETENAKETVNYKITIPKRPAETFTYNAEAVEKNVKKLLVDINGEEPADTISWLEDKIRSVFASLVPADTDYKISALTFDIVREEGDTTPVDNAGIAKTGKAAAKITIINNQTKAEAQKIENTYDLGIKPADMANDRITLADLKSEIETALQSGTVTYAADLDSAKLLEALSAENSLVKSVLDEKADGRKNYTITATVKHNSATVNDPASAGVTVVIRNLTSREQILNEDYEYEWVRVVTVTDTIEDDAANVLKAFDDAYGDVKDFFATQKNVTDIVDNCSGVAADIWKTIEDKAEELVNNPGITVTVVHDEDSYVAPKANTAGDGQPDNSADGTIKFTIKLEQNGRVRNYKVAEITIPKANAGRYAAIADVVAAVKKAVITNTTEYDMLRGIAAGSGSAINADADLKAAIETEIAKVVPKKGGVASATAYLGYEYEFAEDSWSFTPATKKTDASVSFDLVITSKGNSATTATIPVECTDLIKAAPGYQTFEQLVDEIVALETIELATAPAEADWKTKLATALGDLDTADPKLNPTIEVVEGTFHDAVTGDTPANAYAEDLKINVTPANSEDGNGTVITKANITFTVKE